LTLLSALQTAIVEPPVNLLAVMGAGLVLARGRRRRLGMGLVVTAFIGLVVLAVPATSRALLLGLESGLPTVPPEADPPQAIVVLAGDDLRASPGGLIGPPDIGAVTLQRVRAGVKLHRRTGLPVLVSGGVIRPGEPPIGEAMALVMAGEFATPAQWVEARSRTTWENALLTAEMLRGEGIGSVYVVTNAWHMRRSLLAFRRAGLRATAAPAYYTGPGQLDAASFVPSAHAWGDSGFALHEWIGLIWYSMRP
jgi:uncharacterized SAM-binding protein YcdF (DUF218 family)